MASKVASSVVGVDPARVMLDVARLTVRRKNVQWAHGSAEALPVGDGSATVVWSLSAVHHWDDIDAGLAEVLRVLAPAGRFVAIEGAIEPGATGLLSHGWTRPQADSFAEMAGAAGFSDVDVVERRIGDRLVYAVGHVART